MEKSNPTYVALIFELSETLEGSFVTLVPNWILKANGND